MCRQKARQSRYDLQTSKGYAGADAQASRESHGSPTSSEISLIGLFDCPTRVFKKMPPSFRRRQTMRGTHQQTNVKPPFQLRDRFGDRRLTDVQELRGLRK